MIALNKILCSHFFVFLIIGADAFAQLSTAEEGILIQGRISDFKKHVYTKENRLQITYLINIKYPDVAINNLQTTNLMQHGWVRCDTSNAGWHSFQMEQQNKPVLVHRNIEFWKKHYMLMTLSFSYYSEFNPKSNVAYPDNDLQHVLILVHKHKHIKEIEKSLNVLCH